MVPREREVRHRRQRIHDGDDVVGTKLVLDEPHQRLANGHRVRAPDVVVVQEEHEHANVIAIGDELLVVAVADLPRWRRAGSRIAVDLYERELFDWNWLAIFEQLELGLRECRDGLTSCRQRSRRRVRS